MRIFLTGYRGAGKSHVARLLAERLSTDWVDSDDEIERQAGVSIAQMFAEQGEPAFRDLEEQVITQLCQGDQPIVALGGGAILRESTRQRLAAAGSVVWLRATAETLAERLATDSTTGDRRPSLTGQGVLEEITQVLAKRTPLYQVCATLTVDTDKKPPADIADEIIERLRLSLNE